MSLSETVKLKITQFIESAFRDYKFNKISVEFEGSTEKGDNYLAGIAFVLVIGFSKDTVDSQKFHLVAKYDKNLDGNSENFEAGLIFNRELFVYTKALPKFKILEGKRNVKILEQLLPRCYNDLKIENKNILLLQNMKVLGYQLHDRSQPFDLNHLKLTFESYGKWHAFPLAYEDQYPKEFEKIFNNLTSTFSPTLQNLAPFLKTVENVICSILESMNKFEHVNILRKLFPGGFEKIGNEISNVKEEKRVFIHGDCWSGNFLFKYKGFVPTAVSMLDFQFPELNSPIIDLSYHFYATTSSIEQLQHFNELLHIYYLSLSDTLTKLGSDPLKVFPFNELIRQWKKYSHIGLMFGFLLIFFVYAEGENILDIESLAQDNDIVKAQVKAKLNNIYIMHQEVIEGHMLSMIDHYKNLKFDQIDH